MQKTKGIVRTLCRALLPGALLGLGAVSPGTRASAASAINFSFTLPAAEATTAGAYNSSNQLVKTIWRNVRYTAGSHTGTWDGTLDDGSAAPTGVTYTIKVLHHDSHYIWDGVVGNTSASFSGGHTWRTFEGVGSDHSLAISGTTAILTIGYIEGQSGCQSFGTATPQIENDAAPVDQNVVWAYAATDGTHYYLANVGSGWDSNNDTFVTSWNASTLGQPSTFTTSGADVKTSANTDYPSAIDISQNIQSSHDNAFCALNGATGLAVQQSGNVLAVSHGPLNVVRLFHKTTGASLGSITITAPGQIAFAPNGDLWVVSGTTVQRFASATLGATGTPATTISGFSAPLNVAVHPSNNNIVLVADGGASQQIKGYTSTGSAASGWSTPYGTAGGYSANGAAVTTSKFQFGPFTALAVASDGSFWVGDAATQRFLHFTSARAYIDQIACIPTSYVATVDYNNPARVFDGFLEYQVDYTKPLLPGDPYATGGNHSWKLVNNWAAGTPAQYLAGGSFSGLLTVATLSNGRTYAMVPNSATGKNAIVELTAAGSIRPTGTELTAGYPPTQSFSLYGNGDLRYNVLAAEGTPSGVQTVYKQALTGFDASGNPLWGAATTLASMPARSGDPYAGHGWPGSSPWQWPITSTNVLVSFDENLGNTGMHLGGSAVGGSSWLWQASPSVTSDVPPDGLGSYDIGDGTNYGGNKVLASGRNIVYGYHGEFWNQSEMDQFMHFYDDGLFVGQFGTPGSFTSPQDGATPGKAGNAMSPVLAQSNGELYLYVNEESPHCGIHRFHLIGVNAIQEAAGSGVLPASSSTSITLATPAAAFPSGLKATPGSARAVLSWQAASGAASYKVKYGTQNGGPYTSTVTGVTGTTCTVTGLTNETQYFFAVSAVIGGVESVNSAQIKVTPYDPTVPVHKAGQMAGNYGHWDYYAVTSAAPAAGEFALTMHNMLESQGNLSALSIGSRGYEVFDWGGPGVHNSNISSPLTVTGLSGWTDSSYSGTNFTINGTPGTASSVWNKTYNLQTSSTGTVNITPGDSNWHYVTVFSPENFSNPRSATITLTPLGLTTPSAAYSINQLPLGYNTVCQFLFTGNVTLTFTGTQASLQALFFDDAPTPSLVPAAPTDLNATPGGTQVSLSWTASAGATSYNIYRGTTAGGESGTPIATGVTGTTYTNTGLTNGQIYYYKVKAINASGTSGYSNEASATPVVLLFEAESGSLANGATAYADTFASGGSVVGALSGANASVTISGVSGGGGGVHTLTIRYATADVGAIENLYVNGVLVTGLSFPTTGAWNGSGAYTTVNTNVTLSAGSGNTIAIKHDAGAIWGVNVDSFSVN